MNTRALKFQLIVWYAGLLTCCFVLLGTASYILLQRYLVASLKEYQLRRGRQIGQLVAEKDEAKDINRLGQEIESRYAPGLNERFVRVIRAGGEVLYISKPPANHSFDPVTLDEPQWPHGTEGFHRVSLAEGREILIASHVVESPGHVLYLVETGALMGELQSNLRQLLTLLLIGLPVVTLVAVGGGYLLVKRALLPVDQIVASAERISSHNLSDRLPTLQTGDELARLSQALNHMIERLEQAFQHSRRFMADASHELRTPLTVLRGELEGLLQEGPRGSDWNERLGSALEEVERLTNIVEGLFAIARLDAGEAQADWVKFDLAQLVASTSDQMALLAEDKRIKLSCSAGKGVWVEGDRARMKQVVVNLLDNAIKYTPEGGAIALTVSARDSKAVLEVADTGIGIPNEALNRVFERFYRVDKARSREQGGAGLGLSIVKSICAAHGANVEVLSTPGRGSIFRVQLALASTPATNGKVKTPLA